ncbi:hypothetical protein [Streptomyces sp. MMG1533]|uniref:hypothetical protein n=1 Tax=Streptomyces sp. MMG1533 TaxID=1415546 RepID=UPI00099C4ED2|nr:hypothetical protein [Streptomyces sp. MMG1533]
MPTVSGLDPEIADGEFMVLVGPSGCGGGVLLPLPRAALRAVHGEGATEVTLGVRPEQCDILSAQRTDGRAAGVPVVAPPSRTNSVPVE